MLPLLLSCASSTSTFQNVSLSPPPSRDHFMFESFHCFNQEGKQLLEITPQTYTIRVIEENMCKDLNIPRHDNDNDQTTTSFKCLYSPHLSDTTQSKKPNDDTKTGFQHWDRVAPMLVVNIAIAFTLIRRVVHRPPNQKERRQAALADHRAIPMWAKIVIPFLLWLITALFAFSNASIGAKVEIVARVTDKVVVQYALFEFSLTNTITDMWKGGVYPLAIVVLVWSGIWPYLKTLLMFAIWYVPPTRLPRNHRRRLLLTLDVLGKWALIDMFLMNMMSVAFRFHISTSSFGALFKNLLVVDVNVTPEIGLFTFVTAVALSLFANHLLLAYHRNSCGVDEEYDGSQGSPRAASRSLRSLETLSESLLSRDALRRESQDASSDEEGIRLQASLSVENDTLLRSGVLCACPAGSWFERGTLEAYQTGDLTVIETANQRISILSVVFSDGTIPSILIDSSTGKLRFIFTPFLAVSILLMLTMIGYSSTEDSFEFIFEGLAGTLIGWVDPSQKTRQCSMLSIAKQLGQDTGEDANQAEVKYLQLVYITFAFAFPLAVTVFAAAIVFVRLRLRELKIFFATLEIGMSWAAIDVFIASLIAAVMQIDQFSHFLEGDLCDPIKKVLPIDDCFKVKTKLLRGTWLIVFTAMYFWCLIQFIQRIVERAIAERESVLLQLAKLVSRRG
jgi:hypothetical protein